MKSSSRSSMVEPLEVREPAHLHHQQAQQQQQHIYQPPLFHLQDPAPLYEPDVQVAPLFAAAHQEYMAQHYTGPVPVQVVAPEPMPMHMPVPVQVPVVSAMPMPPVQQAPIPIPAPQQQQAPANCQPPPNKPYFSFWWGDVAKFVQQAPALHPHVPFHQQVPLFAALQGCY